MNPHPQSIPRPLAMARAPPPGQSFARRFPASEKNSQLHRPFKLATSPNSAPFTPKRFLNQPCEPGTVNQFVLDRPMEFDSSSQPV